MSRNFVYWCPEGCGKSVLYVGFIQKIKEGKKERTCYYRCYRCNKLYKKKDKEFVEEKKKKMIKGWECESKQTKI